MQLKKVVIACSLSLVCVAPVLAANIDRSEIAQAPGQVNGPSMQYNTGVAMTLYRLLTAGNGAEYYLNAYGQAIPLPGAGVADKESVAVYTGNGGESWYIDRNGNQVDLPEVETPPEPPEQSPYWNSQSQQQPTSQNQPSNVEVINNVPPQNNNNNGGGNAGTTALAAGLGGLVGSFGGAALDMAVGGIPYGVPVYAGWGGGAPYYYGPNGNRTYINNTNINNNRFNEWNNQQSWYRNQVNNESGRYNHNWWPGKEHGFPRPGQQVPGRMYSPENSWNHGEFNRANAGEFNRGNLGENRGNGGEMRREGGFHPEGGERRFGGAGEFHHFGGGGRMFGGGHMGAMHFGGRR